MKKILFISILFLFTTSIKAQWIGSIPQYMHGVDSAITYQVLSRSISPITVGYYFKTLAHLDSVLYSGAVVDTNRFATHYYLFQNYYTQHQTDSDIAARGFLHATDTVRFLHGTDTIALSNRKQNNSDTLTWDATKANINTAIAAIPIVDTSWLHNQVIKKLNISDSTVYYPYASNPRNYISSFTEVDPNWHNDSVRFAHRKDSVAGGFYPYTSNPKGYLTSFTETDPYWHADSVNYLKRSDSLTYYPYKSNPKGYISSYTETDPIYTANGQRYNDTATYDATKANLNTAQGLDVKYTDTSSGWFNTAANTNTKLANYEKYTDTVGTSNRINAKINYSDTSLAWFFSASTANTRLAAKVNYTDSTTKYETPSQLNTTLSAYEKYTDTVGTSNRINLKADSVTRKLGNDTVFYWTNGSKHFGFLDSSSGGTVTSVATGQGLIGGTIVSTGTLQVDSTKYITQASQNTSLAAKQNNTDTSTWDATRSWVNGKGYLTTAVTSVATGQGLLGGTITTTGTLQVDSTKYITQASQNTSQASDIKYTDSTVKYVTPAQMNNKNYLTANQNITFTASGDASATASGTTSISPSFTITGLKGASLPSLSAGNLKYTGSAWAFDNTTYLSSIPTFNQVTTAGYSTTNAILHGNDTTKGYSYFGGNASAQNYIWLNAENNTDAQSPYIYFTGGNYIATTIQRNTGSDGIKMISSAGQIILSSGGINSNYSGFQIKPSNVGLASAPIYSFNQGVQSGMYSSSGNVDFSVSSTQRGEFNSNGLTVTGNVKLNGITGLIDNNYSGNKLTFPGVQEACINSLVYFGAFSGQGSMSIYPKTSGTTSDNVDFGGGQLWNSNAYYSVAPFTYREGAIYNPFTYPLNGYAFTPNLDTTSPNGTNSPQNLTAFMADFNIVHEYDPNSQYHRFCDYRRSHTSVYYVDSKGDQYTSGTIDIDGTTGSHSYDQLRLRNTYTPTSSADANGNTGDVCWDSNYVYVKTASGWKRSALSTF